MADDNLFTESDDKPKSNTSSPTDDRLGAIEKSLSGLGQNLQTFAEQVVSAIKVPANQQPVRQAAPTQTSNEDMVQTLLTEPEKALEQILARRPDLIEKIVQDRIVKDVGPWVQNEVTDKHDTFKKEAQDRIDKVYGDGAFHELLAPEMERIYKTMDANGAGIGRGIRSTFEAVLRQASGDPETISKLWERKNAVEKARASAPDMLDGMPAPRQKTALSESDRAFQSKYEEVTGYKLDPKKLLAILESRRLDSDGQWTAENVGAKNRLVFDGM